MVRFAVGLEEAVGGLLKIVVWECVGELDGGWNAIGRGLALGAV